MNNNTSLMTLWHYWFNKSKTKPNHVEAVTLVWMLLEYFFLFPVVSAATNAKITAANKTKNEPMRC